MRSPSFTSAPHINNGLATGNYTYAITLDLAHQASEGRACLIRVATKVAAPHHVVVKCRRSIAGRFGCCSIVGDYKIVRACECRVLGLNSFVHLACSSPFEVIALISHDPRLLRQVALHHTGCLVTGWTGVAMMCLGVALRPNPLGTVMFWVGTPLAGLAVWLRRDDGGGGDGGGGGGGGGPDVPPIDWDEFERSFWAHVRRRGRNPGRPRVPSAR